MKHGHLPDAAPVSGEMQFLDLGAAVCGQGHKHMSYFDAIGAGVTHSGDLCRNR